MNKIARRTVLAGLAVVPVAGIAACGGNGGNKGESGATSISVSVGRQPYAAGNSPITQYMFENKLFEDAAADYGYDLSVEYQDFPTAAPQVEAMVAERLDFGMWGNTPVVRAAAQQQAVSVIGIGEGSMRFLLVTRKDSGITDISHLEGKSVGVTIGGDPHLALLQMLEGAFGTTDIEEIGISLVDTPSPASAAQVPQGVDATITIHPAYLTEIAQNDNVIAIANSYGETEDGYVGEMGEGAGHRYPSADDSRFAPEGFYSHRSFWVTRNAVLEEHPDVVSAFVQAQQSAIAALLEMESTEVAALVTDYWGEDLEVGAQIVDDELLFRRGWSWATNGDGQVLMKLSEQLEGAGVIDEALTWDETVNIFELASEATGTAYEGAGSAPPAEEFRGADSDDARGAPQWELEGWEAP